MPQSINWNKQKKTYIKILVKISKISFNNLILNQLHLDLLVKFIKLCIIKKLLVLKLDILQFKNIFKEISICYFLLVELSHYFLEDSIYQQLNYH